MPAIPRVRGQSPNASLHFIAPSGGRGGRGNVGRGKGRGEPREHLARLRSGAAARSELRRARVTRKRPDRCRDSGIGNRGTARGDGGVPGGSSPCIPARGGPRRECRAVTGPFQLIRARRRSDQPRRAGPYTRRPITLATSARQTATSAGCRFWFPSGTPRREGPSPPGTMSLIPPHPPHPFSPSVLDARLVPTATATKMRRR